MGKPPSWQAEFRAHLAQSVIDGRSMVSVGGLMDRFGDRIPLHIASRKWALRHKGKAAIKYATPTHMRFYALTQVLHWLGCSFSEKPKTRATIVRIHARPCPKCQRLFVAERHVATCSVACGLQWAKERRQ